MIEKRNHKRYPCPNRCGRLMNGGRHGVCEACYRGAPPPQPNVELLEMDYLLACAAELKRRRDAMTSMLRELEVV